MPNRWFLLGVVFYVAANYLKISVNVLSRKVVAVFRNNLLHFNFNAASYKSFGFEYLTSISSIQQHFYFTSGTYSLFS